MAYPTSPTEVGCTDKAAITTVLSGSQTYSTTQTITNTRFRGPVTVSGGTVTFRNCIFYLIASGSTGVRTTGAGLAIIEDCEYGLGPGDSYAEDPTGWAGAVANVAFDVTGEITRCYIHHANDFVRLKSAVSDCYMHKLVSVVDGHGDGVQMIGGSGVSLVDCYVDARHDPDITPASGWGVTSAVLIKADTSAIDDVTISGCYLDSDGAYTLRVDNDGAFGQPTNVSVSNIDIGSNHTSAPFLFEPGIDDYSVCGLYQNDALISGVSSCPSNDGGNVADFVAFDSAIPSGSTLTLTLPSLASTGDLLLVTVLDEGAQASGGTTDNSAPAGWTLVGTNNSPSRTKDIAVWRKFVDSGETPGSTTYDFTGGSTACVATIVVYEGVDGTAPIAASQFSDDDTFDTDRVITGTTTTAANQRVVVILGDQETSIATPPGDLTSRGSVDTARVIINTDKVQASAGATGTFTFTSAVSQRSCGAVIVLANAAGGSTQDLTGTLHDVAPTFFTGTVAAGAVNLGGALLSVGPTFGTGSIGVGAVNLAGELTQIAPTFFSGVVSAGELAITGSLFQAAPTFNAGAIAATFELSGSLFQAAPSFPQGDVANLSQFLTGALFESSPTFFTGSIGGGDRPRRRNAVVTATRRSATLS